MNEQILSSISITSYTTKALCLRSKTPVRTLSCVLNVV